MNAYFIAEGEGVAGPFTEEQLLSMWRLGRITANAQVCLEGTEEWVAIRTEINTIEAFQQVNQRHRKLSPESVMNAALAQHARGAQMKSEGTAVVLSLLVPCLGHIYAGEIVVGVIGLFIAAPLIALLLFGPLWPVSIILYGAILFDSANAVKRHNAKL